MKKFLSVLLALAVAFTFTFGSTMSAFAGEGDPTVIYTKDQANALLDYAYSQAKADAIEYDYDSAYNNLKDVNGTELDDLTVFNFKAEYVQKAIDEAYTAAIVTANVTSDAATIAGAAVTGDYTDATKTTSADAFAVRNALLNAATLAGAKAAVIEEAAWAEYKEMLTKLVDSVDLSIYTDTVKDNVEYTVNYPAANTKYNTSKAAAEAIIALAKKTIADAEYTHSTASGKYTYAELYDAIFDTDGTGSSDITGSIAVKENKDDAYLDTLVTSLSYVLSAQATDRTLSTVTSEKQDAANEEVNKATAKSLLVQDVISFQNSAAYDAKYDALIAAYQEATNYLIENDTAVPATDMLAKVRTDEAYSLYKDPTSGNYVIKKTTSEATVTYDYIARCDAAKALNDQAALNKSNAAIRGVVYDETKAAKALKAALVKAYKGETPSALYTGETNVTAGQKAAAKIDVSEVKATETNFGVTGVRAEVYQLPVTITYDSITKDTTIRDDASSYYFEAQWKDVVAAIDAYNAAIDAAANTADVDAAENTLYTAISKIKVASAIYTEVAKNTNIGDLNKYAVLTYSRANTGKTTPENIYVTFTTTVEITGDSSASASTPIAPKNVNLWYIAQGATTKEEATAMYADACKVIDGYKTATEEKAAAEAVKAAIAALPTTVTLADKDAIVAAYDAYKLLNPSYTKYVTNFGTLKDAVKAVYKLELNNIRTLNAAIPAPSKIAASDRPAIEAAESAYDAYSKTTAYTSEMLGAPITEFEYDGIDAALENAELSDIAKALNPLQVKWSNDALTADDADAVAALKALVDAYIKNWTGNVNYNLDANDEYVLAKIAAAVDAIVTEAEWTVTDVKASLFDSSRKLTIWRTSKTSIRVTSVGSVADIKDHGYTVKYKFYKKAPGSSTYKLVKTTTSNKYTYTNLKKGTNKFQVKVCVYDADGKLVASKWTYYRAAKIK